MLLMIVVDVKIIYFSVVMSKYSPKAHQMASLIKILRGLCPQTPLAMDVFQHVIVFIASLPFGKHIYSIQNNTRTMPP